MSLLGLFSFSMLFKFNAFQISSWYFNFFHFFVVFYLVFF